MMIQTFASRIMKYILDLNKANPARYAELWQSLSGFLMYDGMPEKAREELYNAGLLIADLDWKESVFDLDFKVIFDVVRMEPVLVGVSSRVEHQNENEQKTLDQNEWSKILRVVNQEEWVKVRWRFFPTIYE